MIVISKIERAVSATGKQSDVVYLELFCDAITELQNFDKADLDIPESLTIRAGSVAYDANMNVAILGSDGNWNTI